MLNKDIHIRDPFVVVKDGTYYMYGTRGENFGQQTGGIDVYKGTDLENWDGPFQVFDSEKFGLNEQANWAPEVHEYKGRYYMFATFLKDNGLRGTYILVSDSLEGEFTPLTGKAITPYEWECLDGTFFVEDGIPYCIFCHEHTQIEDGTVEFMRLSDDLAHAVTEPKTIFKGSSFFRTRGIEMSHCVTDGPFIFKKENGRLIMIWSTCHNGYLQCVAQSDNGRLDGSWTHLPTMFDEDGGHGMIFTGLDGELYLTLHCPNRQPEERPAFFRIEETEESVRIKE